MIGIIYLAIGSIFLLVRVLCGIINFGMDFYDEIKFSYIIIFIIENILLWPLDILIILATSIFIRTKYQDKVRDFIKESMEDISK